MDKNVFQDRQHIPVSRLNDIYTDVETYFSEIFTDALPLPGTVIDNGLEVVATSPITYGVDIGAGTAYDPNVFRLIFPVDATPTPANLTWQDNSAGSGNRNDIVYAYASSEPDDLTTVFFMGQAGNIFQQPIYQRVTQGANFGVSIGTVYGGPFSTANDPPIPSNAVPLARVWNHPGATLITGSTDLGSNAFIQDLRIVYPFTGQINLENLADVSINEGTLTDGQTIRWNATTHKWENAGDLEGPTPLSFTASNSVSGASPYNFTVIHNLGFFPLIQVIDHSTPPLLVIPDSVEQNSVNQFTIGFTSAFTGTVIFK